MREYMGLYRGKRRDNDEWITGNMLKVTISGNTLCFIFGEEFMVSGNNVKALIHALVDPDTIGESTGLRDKNGKLVFEGDVFEWGYAGVKEFRYKVVYDAVLAAFVGERHFGFVSLNGIGIEIIGNIHDNPELSEGGEDDG